MFVSYQTKALRVETSIAGRADEGAHLGLSFTRDTQSEQLQLGTQSAAVC